MDIQAQVVNSLADVYYAQYKAHLTNLAILMKLPQAIPEHTGFIEALDLEVEKAVKFKEKYDFIVQNFYNLDEKKSSH